MQNPSALNALQQRQAFNTPLEMLLLPLALPLLLRPSLSFQYSIGDAVYLSTLSMISKPCSARFQYSIGDADDLREMAQTLTQINFQYSIGDAV